MMSREEQKLKEQEQGSGETSAKAFWNKQRERIEFLKECLDEMDRQCQSISRERTQHFHKRRLMNGITRNFVEVFGVMRKIEVDLNELNGNEISPPPDYSD